MKAGHICLLWHASVCMSFLLSLLNKQCFKLWPKDNLGATESNLTTSSQPPHWPESHRQFGSKYSHYKNTPRLSCGAAPTLSMGSVGVNAIHEWYLGWSYSHPMKSFRWSYIHLMQSFRWSYIYLMQSFRWSYETTLMVKQIQSCRPG